MFDLLSFNNGLERDGMCQYDIFGHPGNLNIVGESDGVQAITGCLYIYT